MKKKSKKDTPVEVKEKTFFPPVVAVLGHVDHGKTTLLDTIRETNIASREHGGITQKIGASSVEIKHEGSVMRVTFIDTPGHETFSKMRSRGAQAADIGLLVVAANDGVKPQTLEAINLLKSAGIPYIVVCTKADLPEKNIEKVKQQLLKEEVILENAGGDTPFIEVSSKTKQNIKELLDLILLVHEMTDAKPGVSRDAPFRAIVIESKKDLKIGVKATVIVKNGSISPRDELVCEGSPCKVKALINDLGKQVSEASIGDGVEILGFQDAPPVGAIVYKKGEDNLAKTEESDLQAIPYAPHAAKNTLPLILCTDTLGSQEAILQAFPKDITILSKKTGEISDADVLLAKSIGAIVIGFNTKIRPEVAHLARQEKVPVKNYTIIYELIDEVSDVLEGKQLALEEKIYGKAKILAIFPYEKTLIAGVKVTEGRLAKGDKVRLVREDSVIGESIINSLRHGKDQTSKVEEGSEGGVLISPQLDITIGDMIVSHE